MSSRRTLHPHSSTTLSLLLLSLLSDHLRRATANVFIYAGCSQEKFQPSSPFETNLNTLLNSAVSSSSQSSYNSFALVGNDTTSPATAATPPDEPAVYGLYQCRGDLNLPDCSRCVQSAINQISLVCPYALGASLQLDSCFIRYEHMDFLGKLDAGLRYKKCSVKSVTNDEEFFRRRDDVLADVEGAIGFRVSSSGLVEGFGQCLGDLGAADCTACLAEAVGKLKSLCGSAVAADVFLDQCYARYWASGYYDTSSDSSSEDEVGKTVAIIVGVVAGVAVFIVLISVCQRAVGSR
ncbi:plasmodesmata-located protein 8 [Rhododendron vialii]|uniref:plasmodesmata-located protein 8 n=1 Tax=Rhododendron vialii TaxID=182163 RepID=UPI00265FE650|nr:plasmodesmata-located protein 8 [Rhododendron vialii]